jgi:hypothetical protein
MTIRRGKGPSESSDLAKRIADTTNNTEHRNSRAKPPTTISEYMAEIGRRGGKIGGKRRMELMTKEQRVDAAKKAARARWEKNKP